MFNADLIDSISYSVWLGNGYSGTTSHGQLVFGGLDTGKFLGKLETLPLIFQIDANWVTIDLTSVSISHETSSTIVSNTPVLVAPDIGTTEIYLPSNMTDIIFRNLGATHIDETGYTLIDCSASSKGNSTTIDFGFGSTTISVPLWTLVNPYNSSVCYLGIVPVQSNDSNPPNILGVYFLYSAYVVYDFTNDEISLAQSNWNSTTENITVIGLDGLGSLTLTGTNNNNHSTSSGSSTTSSTSTSTTLAHHGLSSRDKVGIGAGVGIGAIVLLVGLGISVFWHHRRRRHKAEMQQSATAHQKLELDSKQMQPVRHEVKDGRHLRHELDSRASPQVTQSQTNPEHKAPVIRRKALPVARHELDSTPVAPSRSQE